MGYDDAFEWWEANADIDFDSASIDDARRSIRRQFDKKASGELERVLEAMWASKYGYIDRLERALTQATPEIVTPPTRMFAPTTPTPTPAPTQIATPQITTPTFTAPTVERISAAPPTRTAERAFASVGRALDNVGKAVGRAFSRLFGR